jgi:hypothetical protein
VRGASLGRKEDIRQVKAVAGEFNKSEEERRDFGDFLEQEKAIGNGGSKSERGDFTYPELRQKAREFLNLD